MPLQYTGKKQRMESAWGYEARSPEGGIITVQVSFEALQDYGEARALEKGRAKYDAGQTLDGIKVTIRNSDFK
jgi:hypothetical protein